MYMVATVYEFKRPEPEKKIRIPLYSDEEIEVVLMCVNVYSISNLKYNLDTMSLLDPADVIKCIKIAISGNIFTERFKKIAKNILNNVETI